MYTCMHGELASGPKHKWYVPMCARACRCVPVRAGACRCVPVCASACCALQQREAPSSGAKRRPLLARRVSGI